MKHLLLFIPIIVLSVAGVNRSNSHTRSVFIKAQQINTDTIVIGYINADRIIDTAYITGPAFNDKTNDFGHPDNYNIKINFSGNLPTIHYSDAVVGWVENIGDIDGDGISEIMLVPGWFIGCWNKMNFYTLKNNRWKHFGDADCNICSDESNYKTRVTKINKNKIKVMEEIWDAEKGDIIIRPKIIKMN